MNTKSGWYKIGQHEYFFDEIPEHGIRMIINPETHEVEPENFKMKRSLLMAFTAHDPSQLLKRIEKEEK